MFKPAIARQATLLLWRTVRPAQRIAASPECLSEWDLSSPRPWDTPQRASQVTVGFGNARARGDNSNVHARRGLEPGGGRPTNDRAEQFQSKSMERCSVEVLFELIQPAVVLYNFLSQVLGDWIVPRFPPPACPPGGVAVPSSAVLRRSSACFPPPARPSGGRPGFALLSSLRRRLLSLALLLPPAPGSSWSRVSFPPLPPAAAALPGRPPSGVSGGSGIEA